MPALPWSRHEIFPSLDLDAWHADRDELRTGAAAAAERPADRARPNATNNRSHAGNAERARSEGGKRVLFYSGDDAQAKAEVAAIIDRLGFFGIDLGALSVGSRLVQFPGGPLPALNLVKFG